VSSTDDLPPALPSLWHSLQLGYQAEPKLLVVSFLLTIAAALPDALFALWLKLLAEGVLSHHRGEVLASAAGLGVSATAGWFLRVVSDRVQRRFCDRAAISLEAHVARLQATVATVELHERPEHLDRLAVLRDQVFTLNHLYPSLFGTAGWILRLAVTIGLLVSINPALALLAVFAVPTVLSSSWRSGVERIAEERGAPHQRLARHLFTLGTTASPGKEVRVTGVGPLLIEQRRAAWEGWYASVAAARWSSAVWHIAAWALFGFAYVGAVIIVAEPLRGSPGDVLLIVAAGGRLSQYIGATVGEIGFLRGVWLDASRRLLWLEQFAAARRQHADQPAPARLTQGIRLENVSFRYPGTERTVLEEITLDLPAGSVVAVVGENGAGKSTLVKLLCGFYQPTHGCITIDGLALDRIPAEAWRARLSGSFQDFFRFEFLARHSVGLGDLERIDHRSSVECALNRAGAEDVIGRLRDGLDTQLGPTWRDGVDLSFGQWQKLALARGFMRDHPLLLVLDEPTAALDAETEHALFESFAGQSRAVNDDGRITLLVSHRFSTVRMADLIVVLDGAHMVEYGSHDELIRSGGMYADLYGIQAGAYR
jgi:ATP-binding cassette, subfamily B, bacterial